jgi:molybdopterin molybdotransferase
MDSVTTARSRLPTTPLHRSLPDTFFEWIDAQGMSLDPETVPLREAAGRVLAEPVVAPTNVPNSPTAAGDGYAVRAADTVGASDYSPLPLRLLPDDSRAVPGTARLISSGDPLPAGMDAVLPFELAEQQGNMVEVAGAVPCGEGVSRQGEECEAGEPLSVVGHRLRPQDIARLALAGLSQVAVRRRPSIRLILSGRYRADADGPMLMSLVARDGGVAQEPDVALSRSDLEDTLTRTGADLILIAGATGQGVSDHAPRVLAAVGHLAFHGAAIHPGDSTGLGRVGATPVVLLPGTPLGCLFAYDLFVARLLRRAAGLSGPWPYPARRLPLARKVASSIGRLEICRVRINGGRAEPLAIVDGRLLSTAVQADGFVLVPVQSEGHSEGTEVTVHLYDQMS